MGGRWRKKGGKGKGREGGGGEGEGGRREGKGREGRKGKGREGKGTSVAPPTSEGWRRHCVETSPEYWVGCTNVTDDRRTGDSI